MKIEMIDFFYGILKELNEVENDDVNNAINNLDIYENLLKYVI